jgi:hypothetical protein
VLTPILATAFIQNLIGQYMKQQLKDMSDAIETKKDFSQMDVTHHLLAGFKAIVSDEQYLGLDKCRRACGGAGYASMSGFTEIMAG